MTASALTRPGQRDRLIVKIGQIDWTFVVLLTAIASTGALMLYSVANLSWEPWAAPHMIRYGMCLVLLLVLAVVDLRVWFVAAYPVYAVGLLLLVAVEAIGDVSMGAQRWLDLGFVRLQPSEIMKIGIVLALARFYHGASAQDAKLSWRLLIPAGLIGAPVLLVAHQPDLGTAVLIALTGGAMMVLAGLSLRLIAGVVGLAMVAIPPFVMFGMHDYQRKRIFTFLDPESDPSGSGYHILQSKIALGSGGLLGKGYGLGSQSQLNFLPEKHTDFIFATLAEEFGFVGCLSALLLYGAVILIALRTASLAHSHFGRMAGSGVTATFAAYVLINGAMVMGLAPVVGVPMPMMSYGGTVMLTVMIGFGLVQSVRVHRYSEVTSGRGGIPVVVFQKPHRFNLLLRVGFWIAMSAGLARALWPDPYTEQVVGHWDKVFHSGGCYALTVMAAAAYPRTVLPVVGGLMALFGGLIEVLQALPAINRDASWADLLADGVGICVALGPMAVPAVREWLRRR